MDQDLYNLEFLSLVAKIIQEIDNHTGVNDKTLAEFVISLHDQSNKSLPAFKAKLKEVGGDFPDSFVENVDRLILSMHPKHKKKHAPKNGKGKAVEGAEGTLTEQEKKKRLLPGLAMKDQEPEKALPDDVFLQELGDLVSGKKRPAESDRSPKRQRRGRSPSPRRVPSPRRWAGNEGRPNGGRPAIDDKPVLFKIYNGKVTGMKDFGAFVTLEGVAGRAEGMLPRFLLQFKILTRYCRHGTHIEYSGRTCKFSIRSSQSRPARKSEGHERRW